MPISKEENKIHNALINSQEKILNKMAKIEMDIHKHHSVHGGSIDIAGAFKNLGNTIKSGFEDKIINPIKSGVEEKIINPIKENIPKSSQDILDKIPSKIKDDPKFAKAIDYITKKKGGLASSLLHNAVPATTSAIVGGVTGLATGNPLLGMAGSAAGGYAGKELSDYIGNKTGVGIKGRGNGYPTTLNEQNEINTRENRERQERRRGKGIKNISKEKQRKRKSKKYYSSSESSSSDDENYKKTRPKNSALQQLIEGHRAQEAKELKKGQLMLTQHQVEEMKLLRNARPLEHVGTYPVKPKGGGIKKLIGTKKGNNARGAIVAEVMKKQGLSLGEASKYVSKNNLY